MRHEGAICSSVRDARVANAPRKGATMPIPPRRLPVRRPAPETEPETDQETEAEVDTDTPAEEADTSYLSTGSDAKKRVKDYQEHVSRPRARELFITQAEIEAGEGSCTVPAHFCVNYADEQWAVSAPFITLREGTKFNRYLSPGNGDCALQAGGLQPSIRPVYLVIDHRKYKKQDGTMGGDDVRLWVPPAGTIGLLESAVNMLRDNLGVSGPLDITNYELRITKSGKGRKTTWAVAFLAREKPMAGPWRAAINKFILGEKLAKERKFTLEDYRRFLAKLLAPDPRWLLSKNGNRPYAAAPASRGPRDGDSGGDTDDPPF